VPEFAAGPEFAAAPEFGAPPGFGEVEFGAPPSHVDDEVPLFTQPPGSGAQESPDDPSSFEFVETITGVTAEEAAPVEFAAPPQFREPVSAVEEDELPAMFAPPPSMNLAEPAVDEAASGPVFAAAPDFSAGPPADVAKILPETATPLAALAPAPAEEHAAHQFILEPLSEEATETQTAAAASAVAHAAPEADTPPANATVFTLSPNVEDAREEIGTAPISVLAFAPDRLRRTLSFLQQSDYGKLVSHLFALEAFFPDRVQDEPELDDLFVAVRDAFRSTLDRLFVRLRLPRYAIAARDLEDRSSREAVIGLVKRVAALPETSVASGLEPVGNGIRIRGPIDRESLVHALEMLSDAPLGGVTPWIACVSMLGTTVETAHDSADVLGTYRDALLAVLRVLESLPMSEFHRVLTNSSNAELDKALNDVVRVLGGPVEASTR
jgi:hypothetical protein